jgi:hypothetical protein
MFHCGPPVFCLENQIGILAWIFVDIGVDQAKQFKIGCKPYYYACNALCCRGGSTSFFKFKALFCFFNNKKFWSVYHRRMSGSSHIPIFKNIYPPKTKRLANSICRPLL